MLTKTFAIFATIALGASSTLAQLQPLTIETPTDVKQCSTATFNWSGGQERSIADYVDLAQEVRRNGVPLESFGPMGQSPFVWNVDVTAGSQMLLLLTDAANGVAQSAPFRIAPGFDNCTLQPGF
ncbi:hypothetical protein OH77DRAFT_1519892 [Trametes cingulata]|nr:hypothetical protein OH77DRAFT_1519892 [Trametes cingulata]